MMNNPAIDITDLSKSYGKARGIENVNLEVSQGEIFGFIGPNGAGKSTTIRILMNLLFPSSGSARIMGMDVKSQTKQIKQQTGYIPSDANAYTSMRAGEFLNYCHRFYSDQVDSGRIEDLSKMFDLELERKISDLSFGNRKKISIIQSLIHNPKLLIMDEPTTGLDPLMQSVFFDLLRFENNKGMTIFLSSHILSEVQSLCKRVAIIKDGRIIAVEDIETLRKKQLKKVYIEFGEQYDPHQLTAIGAENISSAQVDSVSFLFSGNLSNLIVFLNSKKINNLIIEEPSLDEIFMHYYKK